MKKYGGRTEGFFFDENNMDYTGKVVSITQYRREQTGNLLDDSDDDISSLTDFTMSDYDCDLDIN